MRIQDREVTTEANCLDPVTYVPNHAEGNCNHQDCQRGVIIRVVETKETRNVFVLYCNTRTVQATHPNDLVWG